MPDACLCFVCAHTVLGSPEILQGYTKYTLRPQLLLVTAFISYNMWTNAMIIFFLSVLKCKFLLGRHSKILD